MSSNRPHSLGFCNLRYDLQRGLQQTITEPEPQCVSFRYVPEELNLSDENLLIQNTYLNSQVGQLDEVYTDRNQFELFMEKEGSQRIKWSDLEDCGTSMVSQSTQKMFKSIIKVQKQQILKQGQGKVYPKELKSIRQPQSTSIETVKIQTPICNSSTRYDETKTEKTDHNLNTLSFTFNMSNLQAPQPQLFEFQEKENIPPPSRKNLRSSSFGETNYGNQAEVIRNFLRSNKNTQFNNYLQEPPSSEMGQSTARESKEFTQPLQQKKQAHPNICQGSKTFKQKKKENLPIYSKSNHKNKPPICSLMVKQINSVKSQNAVATPIITFKPRKPEEFEEKPRMMIKQQQQFMIRNIDIQNLVSQYSNKASS